jgi:hypothetical protein
MTTANMLYTVDFDKYYLKANETVFVDQISFSQISGVTKAFDMVLDYQINRFISVIGVSLANDPHDNP